MPFLAGPIRRWLCIFCVTSYVAAHLSNVCAPSPSPWAGSPSGLPVTAMTSSRSVCPCCSLVGTTKEKKKGQEAIREVCGWGVQDQRRKWGLHYIIDSYIIISGGQFLQDQLTVVLVQRSCGFKKKEWLHLDKFPISVSKWQTHSCSQHGCHGYYQDIEISLHNIIVEKCCSECIKIREAFRP